MVVNKIYDYEDFQQSHLFCLKWIPKGSRVLEFGPATGYMTRYLKEELNCTITGFEYSPEAAAKAASFCEQIIIGDIEDSSLWKQLNSPYDIVIFADVLEHLREPQSVLGRCYELMSNNGRVLISIPNIAHWTIRFNLLKGDFDYASCGTLDNTHLKFFTKKTFIQMIEAAGFVVEEMQASRSIYPLDRAFGRVRLMRVKRLLDKIFDKVFPNAYAFQMIVKCYPDPDFTPAFKSDKYETISGR